MSTAQVKAGPGGVAPPRRRSGRLDAPGVPIRVVKGVVLVILCAAVIVPFIGILSTSVAPRDQLTAAGGFVLFPAGIDLSAYQSIFAGGVVTQGLFVSAAITAAGTGISLATTALLAYALSRPGSFGSRTLLTTVLLTLLFAPGIIPNYLVVKQLGLLDTFWSLLLPTAISAFNVIVMRAFFMGIPQELIDSARIDGAGDFGVFWRVVLPLSKAVLAVIGLFYAVGYWNSFFNALLYINDTGKWPLQLILRTYVVNNAQLGAQGLGTAAESLPPQASIQMSILIVSVLPILLVYPFLQRHFTKGVLTGAVKG